MHDPKRIPIILDALREVWEMIPERQFCAVLINITKRNGGYWEINDEEFVEKLATFKKAMKEQNAKMDELLKQL
jgi:hypothetical protein